MENKVLNDYPDVVTIDEVRKILRVGRNSAYNLIRDGQIKTAKIGTKYIIPKQSVIDFLSAKNNNSRSAN